MPVHRFWIALHVEPTWCLYRFVDCSKKVTDAAAVYACGTGIPFVGQSILAVMMHCTDAVHTSHDLSENFSARLSNASKLWHEVRAVAREDCTRSPAVQPPLSQV